MTTLITGVAGFVGGYLARHIATIAPETVIHGTILPGSNPPDIPGVTYHELDLKDRQATADLIEALRPAYIYHLAAQAFVPRSFEDPWETLENNILSQLNVILACIQTQIQPRMLVVSSAEIYGIIQPHELPITEEAPLRPTSPYGVSKIAQDLLGYQYHLSHDLPIMRVRAFNHIGPGQAPNFVAPAFAMQIARIEAGLQEPVISVGDLSARRDFTDVRDVVRAYHLILQKGIPGAVYNVASGRSNSARELLDILLSHTDRQVQVVLNPDLLRPASIPVLEGDFTRLHAATGWEPQISFEQTLVDILNDCRQRVSELGAKNS